MPSAEPTPLATFAAEVCAHRNRLRWSQVALGEKIGLIPVSRSQDSTGRGRGARHGQDGAAGHLGTRRSADVIRSATEVAAWWRRSPRWLT
jgi:hypothetical protein